MTRNTNSAADCDMDLRVKNTWTVTGDDLNILSSRGVPDYDSQHDLLGGYILNIAGTGCTIGGCTSGSCSLAVKNNDNQYTADENVGKINSNVIEFVDTKTFAEQTYNINYCGDWEANIGENLYNCRSDVCGTSSSGYSLNGLIGGNMAAGGSASQATCGLGAGLTGYTEDWFTVTTSEQGILKVELTGPAPCDWDFWVSDNSDNFKFSGLSSSCNEQSSMELPAGTYKIKVKQYNGNGNGQGNVRVSLLAGTCSNPKYLSALSSYGQEASANTVALSSSQQNDIFKFAVNKNGYLTADRKSTR